MRVCGLNTCGYKQPKKKERKKEETNFSSVVYVTREYFGWVALTTHPFTHLALTFYIKLLTDHALFFFLILNFAVVGLVSAELFYVNQKLNTDFRSYNLIFQG